MHSTQAAQKPPPSLGLLFTPRSPPTRCNARADALLCSPVRRPCRAAHTSSAESCLQPAAKPLGLLATVANVFVPLVHASSMGCQCDTAQYAMSVVHPGMHTLPRYCACLVGRADAPQRGWERRVGLCAILAASMMTTLLWNCVTRQPCQMCSHDCC